MRRKGIQMNIQRQLVRCAGLAVLATVAVVQPATVASAGTGLQMSPLPVPAGVVYSQVTGGDHSGRFLAGVGERLDGTQ
jgi:hypothetical protein